MSYFNKLSTYIILSAFAFSSLMLLMFPGIDLQVSGVFYDHDFYLKGMWWEKLLYGSVKVFLVATVLLVLLLYVYNRLAKKNAWGVDGRKTLFLLLVLLLGAGLVVNVIFKNHFGRARPRDVVEFNGAREFTPVFVMTDQCDKNCSFSSGHGAGAFFALAIAYLFRQRKYALLLAVLYGSLVSFARIVSGGHFFSDNLVSFFVMLITTDMLHHYLIVTASQKEAVAMEGSD